MNFKFKKRLVSFFTSLVVILSLTSPNLFVLATTNPTQITIFHTNDVHGRFLNSFGKDKNLSQIGAPYIAAIKKSVPNSLLVDAGDSTQGLPFATISKGENVIKLMNAAGYDGMTLGNHEFDYGKEQLLKNAKLANFPVVSANTNFEGKVLLEGINDNNGKSFTKTVNGIKVGFFGITTPETAYKTNPANIKGVVFEDPIKTTQAEINKLKADGAQVVVGLMHIGNDATSNPISETIANSVTGLNVLIDGHSHTKENKVLNNTLIVQTGNYSASLGRVDITVGSDGTISSTETQVTAAQATASTPDPVVQALAASIDAEQQGLFKTVVGNTDTTLWAGTVNGQSVARITETNLGNLVADSLLDNATTQLKGTKYEGTHVVALENGGGVRDTIPAGNITKGQITAVLPFGNVAVYKEVTPNILYKAIENGVSGIAGQNQTTGVITGQDGRFPQISGMRFEYDPTKPVQSRVNKIVLINADGTDKQVLDVNDTATKIVLVSNDFEIAGGDGYTMLGALKSIGEGSALDVIATQYIQNLTQKNGGTFSYPITQNRIKAVSNYNYTNYTAEITVKNGVEVIANSNIKYSIDKGPLQNTTTDALGKFSISNIESGAHAVTISYNGFAANAYINNTIGSGNTSASPVSVTLTETDAKLVIDKINALPEIITFGNNAAVNEARQAYEGLNANIKLLVNNYDKLIKAEEKLATDEVITKINNITEVSKLKVEDKVKVTEARIAYDSLGDNAKKLVTNYNTLLKAEDTISKLEKIVVAIDKAIITFDLPNTNTVVSANVLNAIKGQDKTLKFNVEGASFEINGQDIKSEVTSDIDWSLMSVSESLKAKELAKIKAETGKDTAIVPFSFKYTGALPGNTKVTVFLGTGLANKTVKIYRYFENNDTSEVIDTVTVDSNGNATFILNHFSDYFAVETQSAATTATATNLPQTGSTVNAENGVAMGLVLTVVGAATILRRRRKTSNVA